MSFIKRFFEKIISIFKREKEELKKEEVRKVTVTVEPFTARPVKAEVVYKPKVVRKPPPTIQPQILGYRCTLALNYVVHHIYFSYKASYYTKNLDEWEKIRKQVEEELISRVEKEVGYPRDEWWFSKEPSEEPPTILYFPRKKLGELEWKREVVKVGKRRKKEKAKPIAKARGRGKRK